jgi:hypothetical protein
MHVVPNNCGVDDWGPGPGQWRLLSSHQIARVTDSYVGENK